jgi:prephenate dehydrogenase
MKIAIMGSGKMGSWFANILSAGHEVAVYDVDPERTHGLENIRVLRKVEQINKFNPALLINAANLQHTTMAFEQVIPYLSAECILCDITSIKGDLQEYYAASPFRFVSLHPMFGPTFADMASLSKEAVIIIEESDREGAQFFRNLFEGLSVRVFGYSFAGHDKMMAYSLTLPFVSSMAFAACLDGSAVPGTTFAKHWTIASGLLSEDSHLLGEILFNPYSIAELEQITGRLEHLKHIIKARDQEELERFLNRLRDNMPRKENI